jgi:serpin B
MSDPTVLPVETSRSSNAFAIDVHRALAPSSGNLVTSPASIATALAMAWAGARGQTEAELRSVMYFDGTRAEILARCASLACALGAPGPGVTLRLANRLFASAALALEPEFVVVTGEHFAAAIEQVDFGASEAARARINDWVALQTEQRIRGLLPAGSIDPLIRLVVINAIYFLASWEEKFLTSDTRDDRFQVAPGEIRTVPMMNATRRLPMAEAAGSRILELPYAGGSAAMLIVLPDRVDGLADVEAELTASTFERWREGLAPTRVEVSLPRFTFDPPAPLDLVPLLTRLGMPTAFDEDQADFTGITRARPGIYIAKAFHKVFLKVDEQGTEAAAATAILFAERSVPPPPETFRVDRPFLFAIVDRASGLILFLGRVTDPSIG